MEKEYANGNGGRNLVEVPMVCVRSGMGEYKLVDEEIKDEVETSGGGWPSTTTKQP